MSQDSRNSQLSSLPEVEVVIAGGGIIGVSAAYYLSKAGVSVALCEKGRIAGEQSSRNWGFIRQQGRAPVELPIMMESLRLWCGLGKEIGEDLGFRQNGVVYATESEADMAAYEFWLEIAKQYQLDTRLLSAKELKGIMPGTEHGWAGALYTPSDGQAEPLKAAPIIARAAERLGAHVLEKCAVRGIETEGGRLSAVVTEHGRIKTSALVFAGGSWSSLFCRNLGLELPVLTIRSSALRTSPAPVVTEAAVYAKQVAIRRREDGGYTVSHGYSSEFLITPALLRYGHRFLAVYKKERKRLRVRLKRQFFDELLRATRWRNDEVTPFEKVRVLDPPPNEAILDEALINLKNIYPGLRNVAVAERWAGVIDATPDAVPVISPVETIPGLYLATGFSGHGFGIGPGAGKVVAEMVTGSAATIDRTPFRYSRFFDGSHVRPWSPA